MKLNFSYEDDTDALTIEGIRYSGALFRSLGIVEVGRFMLVEKRFDGVITVRRFSPELEAEFRKAANMPAAR